MNIEISKLGKHWLIYEKTIDGKIKRGKIKINPHTINFFFNEMKTQLLIKKTKKMFNCKIISENSVYTTSFTSFTLKQKITWTNNNEQLLDTINVLFKNSKLIAYQNKNPVAKIICQTKDFYHIEISSTDMNPIIILAMFSPSIL